MGHNMQKSLFAISLAILVSACGQTEASDANANPWSNGPQPQGAPQQAQAQANNTTGEPVSGHPAAEPPMPATAHGSCGHMHPGGQVPRIVNAEYAATINPTFKQLCYRSFHLGHSGRTRTALWSAEVLDKNRMLMASRIERDSTFKADDRLPENERSELEDYRYSGYDRGHLAPSADMPSKESQQESFRLSNIVPQNGRMNGGVWRELEMNIRRSAYDNKIYVVTGPIFKGSNKAIKKRVLVPTSMFKAIYTVDKGAVVFVITNDDNAKGMALSLNQFTSMYGLDPFPALTGVVRSHNISLGPIPEQTAQEGGEGDSDTEKPCVELLDKDGTWYYEDFYYAKNGKDSTPEGRRLCE